MTAYRGTFKKKDGTLRTMQFLVLRDLPKEFVAARIKGGQKHSLNEGMELVWDIDEGAFRIFNRTTVVDTIEEYEYNFNPAS